MLDQSFNLVTIFFFPFDLCTFVHGKVLKTFM